MSKLTLEERKALAAERKALRNARSEAAGSFGLGAPRPRAQEQRTGFSPALGSFAEKGGLASFVEEDEDNIEADSGNSSPSLEEQIAIERKEREESERRMRELHERRQQALAESKQRSIEQSAEAKYQLGGELTQEEVGFLKENSKLVNKPAKTAKEESVKKESVLDSIMEDPDEGVGSPPRRPSSSVDGAAATAAMSRESGVGIDPSK